MSDRRGPGALYQDLRVRPLHRWDRFEVLCEALLPQVSLEIVRSVVCGPYQLCVSVCLELCCVLYLICTLIIICRLTLPGRIVEDGREKASFDIDKGKT